MKLTEKDLRLLKDNAISKYVSLGLKSRLPEMDRDLTEDERRTLSYLEASITCLNRLGVINQISLEALNLRTVAMTNGHDVLDEETEGLVANFSNKT